jgi:3-dehydroshikimate dehydratase
MIKTGLCSLTLGTLSVEEVVDIVKQAGLDGIEWWGKDHVPHGDIKTAKLARKLTSEAGLKVSSYGSYYRAGVSEEEGLSFQNVLDTALALGAPTIRIWAGDKNYEDATPEFIKQVIDDTIRIADMAADKDISITFEYHGGTLTDRNDTAIKFASQILHPNVFFSWQSPHGYPVEYCLEGLEDILERLSTIHVYHWTVDKTAGSIKNVRHPLAHGSDRWKKYVNLIKTSKRDHYMLLEFVKNDSPEQVIADAKILKKLVSQ